MELKTFLDNLERSPSEVEFEHTMATIDANYDFEPTAFSNGDTKNEANQNNGSCKIFAFAQLNGLDVESTLACFGRFYRVDVLEHPTNNDHQNIRNFITHGWSGITFEQQPLIAK